MQVTTGKKRSPESIGYNNLMALRFPTVALAASQAAATVQARIPLGLNVKIMAISYVMSGTVAGTADINVSQGAGSYEGVGTAAYGSVVLANTFSIDDTVTMTVGGVSSVTKVNSRTAGKNQLMAEGIASGINKNQPFGAAFVATSSGSTIYIVSTTYGTGANATTLTSSASSASGTATASGSTFANGSGVGAVPTMPALDNSNQTSPPATAAAGTALFPVDMPINMTADVPSNMYPTYPKNFDAIFPSASELTLRTVTNGSASGNLDVILWCVPYDVNAYNPELKGGTYFTPNQTNI